MRGGRRSAQVELEEPDSSELQGSVVLLVRIPMCTFMTLNNAGMVVALEPVEVFIAILL